MRHKPWITLAAAVVALWLGLGGVTGQLFGKLSSVQKNDTASFLPGSAESTKAYLKSSAFSTADKNTLPAVLLFVGDGRRELSWPRELLDAGVRNSPVAPARGLVLEEVYYPDDDALLARQEFTRQIRDSAEVS